MKHIFFSIALLMTACSAQMLPADNSKTDQTTDFATIYLKNNSILPHQYTIVGYEAGPEGNWTNGLFLMPYCSHKFLVKVGAKIYNATDNQVGNVMGGGSLFSEKPLVEVKREDDGKVFQLRD